MHVSPEDGPVSGLTLAIATASMNKRIRRIGLSTRELWIQREQISGLQLAIEDHRLIYDQVKNRAANHWSSAHSKSRGKTLPGIPYVRIDDLVFLGRDRDKTKAKDRYMITDITD